ncbi:MAG: ribosomal protein S18-alanine N-acetyltransferase [Acidiferrobacterales bacterium]
MSAVIKPTPPLIRPMEIMDIKRVMKVERAAYEFPWTPNIFRDCLRVGYYCCVIEDNTEVIGHAVMSYAVGECHILNVCILPEYQRLGMGKRVIKQLLEVGERNGARIAFLEVRLSNIAAYQLYESLGFTEVGIRKDYYPAEEGREDAMILAYDMGSDQGWIS